MCEIKLGRVNFIWIQTWTSCIRKKRGQDRFPTSKALHLFVIQMLYFQPPASYYIKEIVNEWKNFPGQIYKKNIFLSAYEIEIKEIVCLHFIDFGNSNQFFESIWNLMGSEHHKTSKRIHSFVRSQGWIDNIQGRQLFILDVSGDYSYLNDVIKDINLQFLYHKAFKWIPW